MTTHTEDDGGRKALRPPRAYLGDQVARVYGVAFTGSEGDRHHPFATSWDASWRLVGGVIDDPRRRPWAEASPAVAPHQAVVVPIQPSNGDGRVAEAAAALCAGLRAAGVRVRLDDRDHLRPGAKFYEWELKGVPVRLELGARDLDAGLVTVVRRDGDGRSQLPLDGVAAVVPDLLGDIQRSLFEQAQAFQFAHTAEIEDRHQLFAYLSAGRGFAVAPWCGHESCEAEVKGSTSATIRLLTLEAEDPGAPCAVCGRPGTETATWAQAY